MHFLIPQSYFISGALKLFDLIRISQLLLLLPIHKRIKRFEFSCLSIIYITINWIQYLNLGDEIGSSSDFSSFSILDYYSVHIYCFHKTVSKNHRLEVHTFCFVS